MKLQAYLLLSVLAVVFIVVNTFDWQPGIGGRQNRTPGTQLERYFGWPAIWRAELWDSPDPTLASRILKKAPFYWPNDEMHLNRRTTGLAATAVNLVLLLCCCGLIIVHSRPTTLLAVRFAFTVVFGAGLIACVLMAKSVAVSL